MLLSRRQFVLSGAIAAAGTLPATGMPIALAKKTEPARAIIDVHLHAYPASMVFDFPVVNPITKRKSAIRNGVDHMLACMEEMTRYNVVRAIVSGGNEDRIAAALEWHRKDPTRVIAGAGIRGSAEAPLPPVDRMRKLFATGDMRVLGEVTAQYAGFSISNPLYDPYLALAEEFDVPVAVHLGPMPPGIPFDPCCRTARAALGHPETIEDALNRHPKLRINLMHSGWPYVDEAMATMQLYSNVNVDMGTLSWGLPAPAFNDYLRRMIDAGFGKRVMFGTDQMYWPDAIGLAIERIETASFLSEQEKQDIFFNNAAKFYRVAVT